MHSANRVGLLVATLVAFALAGCTALPAAPTPTPMSSAAPMPTPMSSAAPEPTGVSQLDLVGLWKVTEAEGARPDTWLAMSEGWLTIWTPCDAVSGTWVSDGVRLRAQVSHGFGPCLDTTLTPEPWFAGVRGFDTIDDSTARLIGEGGDRVATLTRVEVPAPFDFAENGPRQPELPVVTDEMLAAGDPAPLPKSVVPIDDDLIAGTWALVGYKGSGRPEAVFETDGGYFATDGCNGVSATYLLNEGGRFRAGSGGGSTQVGCDNVELPEWIATTDRAGIDPESEELVLFDADGVELARMSRSG